MTKTAEKTIPFGAAHTYIAHIREYPPPGYFPLTKYVSLARSVGRTSDF